MPSLAYNNLENSFSAQNKDSKDSTMEKQHMYSIVTPSRPQKKTRWVVWVAVLISVTGLIVAGVTGYLEKRQMDRLNQLEETVLQMEVHMEQMIQFTRDLLDYTDPDYPQEGGMYEELTVRGVVRKKRQAPDDTGVPIYDQAYGVNLNNRFNSEGLRLYESFVDSQGRDSSDQVSVDTTESPIKPHHRVSNLWVPKKRRQRYPSSASDPELFSRAQISREVEALEGDYFDDQVLSRQTLRRPAVLEKRSRVKVTDPTEGAASVTSRLNSVVPQTSTVLQAPTVVEQRPQQLKQRLAESFVGPYFGKDSKKKRPRKKHARRGGRRRSRSAITMGHFVAAPANRTSHHVSDGEVHDEWSPAAWMDKLGLNRKYALRRGAVTVKEAGLYYLYAQVLYEPGRFGTGFQLMVDGIPVMECTMTPSQPSHSCHTSGTTYLQRNASVYVRDRESHMTTVRREENSFFGLIKLMDAPDSAEKLLLG